ncbi:MAG: extracellular solute-binding protein [Spirochaetaceae bacterium]|jgi:lactose/L-arabinose transport system substrate-binding protein|nr:extracellular solute-binding protein [Spirochaetaceae bacterium]
MRKLFTTLFILLFIGTMAFAGGGQQGSRPADPNAPVTITVWTWDPTTAVLTMQEAAKLYMQAHPNITVNVVETPWDDVQSKLITAVSSGQTASLPDIISMQDNAAQKNIINFTDAFIPFDGRIDLSQFAKFKVDIGSYNGKNYSFPLDNGASASFIRKDIVEQAGLKVSDFNDITWERYIELAKIVKQKTGIPMLSGMSNSSELPSLMLQSTGTWYFDAQGKANLQNNAPLKRILELNKEMIDSGIYIQVPDWNSYIATLNKGTVAGTINGCWIIGSIRAEASQSGKWAMVNTPRLSGYNSVNYSNNGGSSWMVLSNSRHPDVAMDFLNSIFASPSPIHDIMLNTGLLSCWAPAGQSSLFTQSQEYFGGQKVFEELMAYAGKVPPINYGVYNYEARDAISRALTEYLQGSSLDSVLATAQKNVEFLMGQ